MRSFLAVLLATGLWACTERAPAELPSDARRHWPHEPPAFRILADQSWDSLDSGGWWRPWGTTGLVRDPDAPLSPPSVLEIIYPQGFRGGSAPGTEVIRLGRVRSGYVGIWWMVSDPWQGHLSNGNKIQYLFTRSNGSVFMAMYGTPGGPYELRVYPQFATSAGVWLTPNVSHVPVTLGKWHQIEWLLVYNTTTDPPNGICRWWMDGKLIGDYGDLAFPGQPLSEYKLDPVWGGVGDVKLERDFFRYDHVRISGR